MAERVGDRSVFAIEFEVSDYQPRTWNECWGRLWLWVGSNAVGNLDEIEMIQTGLDSLKETALDERRQASEALQGLRGEDALDAVMKARYDEEEWRAAHPLPVLDECLASVEVLPRLTGPFFDGWEAILLDCGESERLLYRREGAETLEAVWPTGTFAGIVSDSNAAFESYAREIIKTMRKTSVGLPKS